MKLQIVERADGQWHVRLVAGNNRVLMHSEAYTRRRDAVRAAARIARTWKTTTLA